MVQTRSITKKLLRSGQQGDTNSEVRIQNNTVEHNALHDDTQLPPKKRRRVTAETLPIKPPRRNPGELCRLNLDLLYMIFYLSHPLDLLNFARTCKSVRAMLMTKSAASIWKAARRQAEGLPDCPSDLSEPAYANLAFYPCCHVCGKYTSKIFWYMRRRYCTKCRVGRFCRLGSFPRTIWNTIIVIGEGATINKELRTWFDKDQIGSWVKEYEPSSDKEEFLANKRKHYHDIYLHARQCEQWQRQMASNRKEELRACRQEQASRIV